MRVVGIKKMRRRRAPNRVKKPIRMVTLPTSSRKMAPMRKKLMLGMPNWAMYFAVPSKLPIFPIPDSRKIKIRRILPINIPKDFNHSIDEPPFLNQF
jgi:hypothetical protein